MRESHMRSRCKSYVLIQHQMIDHAYYFILRSICPMASWYFGAIFSLYRSQSVCNVSTCRRIIKPTHIWVCADCPRFLYAMEYFYMASESYRTPCTSPCWPDRVCQVCLQNIFFSAKCITEFAITSCIQSIAEFQDPCLIPVANNRRIAICFRTPRIRDTI
jgi:hypothetical protein